MTKQTEEALKMAIEALETSDAIVAEYSGVHFERIQPAIQACKEALEQPLTRDWKETIDERIAKDDEFKRALEQPAQEPVAWLLEYRDDEFDYWHKNCDEDKLALEMWFDAIRYHTTEHKIYPLYTNPAPSWQGLSDDEIDDVKTKAIMGANGMSVEQLLGFIVSLTEQALKNKNGKV